MKGHVFDVQHFSIHDGPGIRTTVFLSGCSLRCKWCQNPESHSLKPVLLFISDRCTACGICMDACPESAIMMTDGRISNDRTLCTACGKCADICPTGARETAGFETTVDELMIDLESDRVFYDGSGGGITLSGGEVLVQPDFTAAILEECRKAGLSSAVETTGNASWETVKQAIGKADLVLYDLKHMDSAQHKLGTGVENIRILENLKLIKHELKIPVIVRIPVIPGYNDSDENMVQSAAFIAAELGTDTKVNLLPYHRMGVGKHIQLEQAESPFETEPPSDERMNEIKKIFENNNLTAEIGG